MAKREIKCSNCGGKGHNARSCKKDPPKESRHLMTHEVVEGGTYWAPYGSKGWSAVQIISKGYKHAKVMRVKPKTQEVVNKKGKVRLDELLRRDPKLAGADRPSEGPDELLASFREQREQMEAAKAPAPEPEINEEPEEAPEEPERTPEEEAERAKRIAELFAMIDDDSTIDDW